MNKNSDAVAWLDRIYWRLLADDASTPRGAHLNQVNWHERQFIVQIRRSFQRRMSTGWSETAINGAGEAKSMPKDG